MNPQDKEVVATLLKAGRRDLAVAFAKSRAVTAGTKESDAGWDAVAKAWKRAEGSMTKVLKAKEADILSNPGMKSSYQKSLAKIRKAIAAVNKEISANAEAL
jgi:hypothetical protein